MKKLIVISDWSKNNLDTEHFRTSVYGFMQSGAYPQISFIAEDNSIAAGYQLSVLINTEHRLGRPQDTVFFVDLPLNGVSPEVANQPGQGQFTILRLASGMYVCGVNSGYVFSLIKSQIQHAFTYSSTDDISQISERESYARILSFYIESIEDELELDEVHTSSIPEIREKMITYADASGHLYTNITLDDLKGKAEFGQVLKMTIHGKEFDVTVCGTKDMPRSGELSLCPSPYGSAEIDSFYLINRLESNHHTDLFFSNLVPGTDIHL